MTDEIVQQRPPGVHLHMRDHVDRYDPEAPRIIIVSLRSDTNGKAALTDSQFRQLWDTLEGLQEERRWHDMSNTADAPFETLRTLQVLGIGVQPDESLDGIKDVVKTAIEALGLHVVSVHVIPNT